MIKKKIKKIDLPSPNDVGSGFSEMTLQEVVYSVSKKVDEIIEKLNEK